MILFSLRLVLTSSNSCGGSRCTSCPDHGKWIHLPYSRGRVHQRVGRGAQLGACELDVGLAGFHELGSLHRDRVVNLTDFSAVQESLQPESVFGAGQVEVLRLVCVERGVDRAGRRSRVARSIVVRAPAPDPLDRRSEYRQSVA